MEQSKLKTAASVIAALGVIVLITLALVLQFGTTLRTTTSVANMNITLGNTNATVAVGTTGQYPYLQTVTSCGNATNASGVFPVKCYAVREGNDNGGQLYFNYAAAACDGWQGDIINCSITYLADSDASDVADNFTTGIAYFGTFSVILVITLIGYAVIRMFMKGGKGKNEL